jgi:uncharacterized protein YggE
LRGIRVPTPLLLLLCACAHVRGGGHDSIRVSGEGRAPATPDLATVSLGVDALAPNVGDAAKDADGRMRAVLEAVRAAGVAAKDVRTTRYDVQLEQRYQPNAPPVPAGYRVTHLLHVVVRGGDPARTGGVLDAALRAGANVVQSISFEKEDVAPERARALEAAVADARARAEALARAAGRTLGEVRSVSEAGTGPIVPLVRARGALAAQAAAPVQAGELEVTAQVEVEFGLR